MHFAYQPGEKTSRQYSGYTVKQEHMWQGVNDVAYAAATGFVHTRHPTPGVKFDRADVEKVIKQILLRWKFESSRQKGTRGIQRSDLPEHAWLYLYQYIREKK